MNEGIESIIKDLVEAYVELNRAKDVVRDNKLEVKAAQEAVNDLLATLENETAEKK